MKILGPFEDRASWLEARRGGIGSSDIAAIVGVSPWGTPWSVYVDKIGAVSLDDEGNEAMAWGRILEDTILDQWQQRTGLHAHHRQTLAVHKEHDWVRVTVDALASESSRPTILEAALYPLEVKVSSDWRWDEIPLHYQAQGQWSMLVTGFDQVEFVVLHNARRLETYTLKADYDDQQALLAAASDFWENHVLAEVPPPVSGDDNKALNLVYPWHEEESEVPVEVELVKELVAIKAEQKLLESRRDDLEARIKEALKDAEIGVDDDGEKIVSWKTQSNNRFETSRLKAEQPDIYRAYMPTDKTTRVLRTHIKETESE